MKAIAALGIAGILGFGLVGCSTGTSEPSPTPIPTVTVTVTPTPEATELTQDQKDSVFLKVVRDEYPQYNDSDKDLLDLADATCQKFGEGASGQAIRGAIDPNASNSGYLSFIIGAAVGVYCPAYSDELLKK